MRILNSLSLLLQPSELFTGKYRLWSINALLIIGIGYTLFTNPKIDIYQSIIAFLIITPFILIIKPKIIVSRNILFMSLYTYFTVPLAINFIIGEQLKISIFNFLFFVFLSTIILFTLMYLFHRKSHRNIYLNHAKISLDIVRFVFLVIVTLGAVYGKILDDFGKFTLLMPIFKNAQTEELRSYFQLTLQIIAIPFIFSTTLLRIVVDWLLLKK